MIDWPVNPLAFERPHVSAHSPGAHLAIRPQERRSFLHHLNLGIGMVVGAIFKLVLTFVMLGIFLLAIAIP